MYMLVVGLVGVAETLFEAMEVKTGVFGVETYLLDDV